MKIANSYHYYIYASNSNCYNYIYLRMLRLDAYFTPSCRCYKNVRLECSYIQLPYIGIKQRDNVTVLWIDKFNAIVKHTRQNDDLRFTLVNSLTNFNLLMKNWTFWQHVRSFVSQHPCHIKIYVDTIDRAVRLTSQLPQYLYNYLLYKYLIYRPLHLQQFACGNFTDLRRIFSDKYAPSFYFTNKI